MVNLPGWPVKLFWGIIALGIIFSPPFFLGLFFEQEMSIHHYFVSGLLLAISIYNIFALVPAGISFHAGFNFLPGSPYFWSLAGITVLYGLSFFNAVHPREALFTWLKHIDYLLTFILVFWAAEMGEKESWKNDFNRWMLVTLAVTGSLLALTGILTAQGIISLKGGLTAGRLAATFQYPNSFAVYLVVTLVISAYLALNSSRYFSAGFFSGIVFLSFLAIIGSQSRSVLLMLPLVLAIFILGQANRYQAVILLTLALVIAIISAPFTIGPKIQQAHANWGAFLFTLAGWLAVGNTGASLVTRLPKRSFLTNTILTEKETPESNSKKVRTPPRRIKLIMAIICVCTALFLFFTLRYPGTGENTWDALKTMFGRLTSTSSSESSLQYRLAFYHDALSMIKERPLFGWGGGGWKSAYPAYQSFNYFSTQVHSHYLQVWLETGTLGLIMFILPFIFLLDSLRRIYPLRRSHPLAPENWAVGTALLTLSLHGTVDFDLSFSSISLLLWSLMALFASREKALGVGYNRYLPGIWPLIILTLAAVFLAGETFVLKEARNKAETAISAAAQGDLKTALENSQKAAQLDRWSAQYPVMQAKILRSLNPEASQETPAYRLNESIRLAEKAIELEYYNADYHFFLAQLYLDRSLLEKALAEAGMAKALRPWQIQSYEEYNRIYLNAAVQQLLGQEKAAGATLRQVLVAAGEAINAKGLALTPALAVTSGQSALLLGNYRLAQEYLSRAAEIASGLDDQRTQAIARLWLGAALLKDGDPSGAELIEAACHTGNEILTEYYLLKQLVDMNHR